jgi:hypothetical protein
MAMALRAAFLFPIAFSTKTVVIIPTIARRAALNASISAGLDFPNLPRIGQYGETLSTK